jgi:hypothetical protein
MNYYPKVRTVGHREIAALLEGPVIIQEKVDGSNFTFGKTSDGELFAMSRAQRLDFSRPEKMFAPALEHVQAIAHKIPDGYAFRCEYLRSNKHNVLAYTRAPKNHLVLFEAEQQRATGGWLNIGDERSFLENTASEFDIDLVPEFFNGYCTLEQLVEQVKEYHTRRSFLGLCLVEGVVIKNFNRFTPDGSILVGKLVREQFKEQHTHVKRATGEIPDKVTAIGAQFGGPERWQKAVQFLRDQGKLTDSPEDIPALLRRVQEDVEAEGLDDIKEALWKQFKGAIFKGCRQGLPEWYKAKVVPDVMKGEQS